MSQDIVDTLERRVLGMGMALYLVQAAVLEKRSVTELARSHGVSRAWIYELIARYKASGEAGLEKRSTKPRSCSHAVSRELVDAILELRLSLEETGLDAGPETICYHLAERFDQVPSVTTIWRILKRNQEIAPQPKKRPKCSYVRFQADLPNETWQADFCYWYLSCGKRVEILNFLDDHSRLLLASKVFSTVKAQSVVTTFDGARQQFGVPQSVLTDNGVVFTARYQSGKVLFESVLEKLGVQVKHSTPYHPQTCGKVERFHQTLKKWLAKQPTPNTVEELQVHVDRFVFYYNQLRPHRALERKTPAEVFASKVKAGPRSPEDRTYYRVRNDKVSRDGTITLRHQSRLYHVGIGRPFKHRRVKILVAGNDVTVIDEEGEILRKLILDPNMDYQRVGA